MPLYLHIIIVGILAVYYLWFYLKYKSPDKSKTVDSTSPPDDMSPAALRYIYKADYDSDCLLAGMLHAGSTEAFSLFWYPNRFIIRLKNPNYLNQLHDDEKAALTYGGKQAVRALGFEKERNKFIDRADERMMDFLKKKYSHLLSNYAQFQARGIYFLVVLYTLALIFMNSLSLIESILFGASFLLIGISFLYVKNALKSGWDWFYGFRDVILVGFGISLALLVDWLPDNRINYLQPFLLTLLAIAPFNFFLPKLTQEGLDLWYKINGYRNHLTEQNLNLGYEQNDANLAYQVALGIDSLATKPFEKLLTQAKLVQGQGDEYDDFHTF